MPLPLRRIQFPCTKHGTFQKVLLETVYVVGVLGDCDEVQFEVQVPYPCSPRKGHLQLQYSIDVGGSIGVLSCHVPLAALRILDWKLDEVGWVGHLVALANLSRCQCPQSDVIAV